MAALGTRFVWNYRLRSEKDRFLKHCASPISRSARPPAVISCCIDSGARKISMKALAKLEAISKAISKATRPWCIEAEGEAAMKMMEHWIGESVVEIVQNLRGSSLLAEVYKVGNGGKFRLKIGKVGAGPDDWPEIQEQWKKDETSSPDGIIVVEELKDEGEEIKVNKEQRFWGVMVVGKGLDCAPCCYVLKTNTENSGLPISATYFVLNKVQNFTESAKSQIDRLFLVDGNSKEEDRRASHCGLAWTVNY